MDYAFYKYAINELTIDDNMFTYETRSAKFINLEISESGKGVRDIFTLGTVEGKEILKFIGIEISSASKIITRTRRKFWDDVSLRGGQYSAVMILLTTLYSLFQGPF